MKKEGYKTVSFKVPLKFKEFVKREARAQKITMSEYINNMIRQYLLQNIIKNDPHNG